MDIDRGAAAGGLNGRWLVGSEGCFSATRGREGVDDTATAAWLFDSQASGRLCLLIVPVTSASVLVMPPPYLTPTLPPIKSYPHCCHNSSSNTRQPTRYQCLRASCYSKDIWRSRLRKIRASGAVPEQC